MTNSFFYKNALLIAVLTLVGCDGGNSQAESMISQEPAHDESERDHGEEPHADDDQEDDHAREGFVPLSAEAAVESGIQTVTVKVAAMTQLLSLPAEIRADSDRVANVSASVSGVIGKVYVKEGDVVTKGQTLALIQSRELASLKSDWLTALSRESLARSELKREQALFDQQITAEAELQKVRAEFAAAKAQRDAAENVLHVAGVTDTALKGVATAANGQNANAYLYAPVSGTLVRRNVTIGETVTAGDASAQPLFVLIDDRVVWADIAVYRQDLEKINKGASVALMTLDDEMLARATIDMVLPIIDESSRTATARAIVANPNRRLRPGQLVTAVLSLERATSALQVPKTAVQQVDQQPVVFVPVEGGYMTRAVTLGGQSGEFIEIRSGLKIGELVVNQGSFVLKAQLEKGDFGDGHGH